jgi:hypothetical protein
MTSIAVQIWISPNERLALARAIESFQSLFVLDHVWTGLATSHEPNSHDDEAVLTDLVSSILHDLERARVGATWLQDFVVRTGAVELREAIREASRNLPEELSPLLEDLDQVYGGRIGELAESCYETLRDAIHDQRISLARELASILSGENSEGDLFRNVICALAAGATVAGLILTAIPPHIQGPIIAGAGATTAAAYKCNPDDLEKGRKWRFGT